MEFVSFDQACDEVCDAMSSLESVMVDRRPLHHTIMLSERWAHWFGDRKVGVEGYDALQDHDIGVRSLLGRQPQAIVDFRAQSQNPEHRAKNMLAAITMNVTRSTGPCASHVAPRGSILVEQRMVAVRPITGELHPHWFVFGSKGFADVSRLRRKPQIRSAARKSVEAHALTLLGADLRARYEWQVAIGPAGASTFAFMVDRAECANMFATRDALPGRSRRTALRHFVEKHARRRPDDAGGPSDVDVRRYLRGQMRFSWNGLDCEIIPPAFEVEAIEASKH